jgi:C-terminal processing protease CtpA/Prc
MNRLFTIAALFAVAGLVLSGTALAGGDKCALSAKKDGKCCADMQARYKTQGWLGIEKGMNEDGTFTVAAVLAASPAEKAGLREGDVIESINGTKLTAENGAKVCSEKAEKAKIGESVTYGVRRGEERLTVSAELGRIPETVLTAMVEKHEKEHKTAHN